MSAKELIQEIQQLDVFELVALRERLEKITMQQAMSIDFIIYHGFSTPRLKTIFNEFNKQDSEICKQLEAKLGKKEFGATDLANAWLATLANEKVRLSFDDYAKITVLGDMLNRFTTCGHAGEVLARFMSLSFRLEEYISNQDKFTDARVELHKQMEEFSFDMARKESISHQLQALTEPYTESVLMLEKQMDGIKQELLCKGLHGNLDRVISKIRDELLPEYLAEALVVKSNTDVCSKLRNILTNENQISSPVKLYQFSEAFSAFYKEESPKANKTGLKILKTIEEKLNHAMKTKSFYSLKKSELKESLSYHALFQGKSAKKEKSLLVKKSQSEIHVNDYPSPRTRRTKNSTIS